MDEIKIKIREFIKRFFRNKEFSNSDDIFALGFVNSLFAMQLVMYLEKEFEVHLNNEELDLVNFGSVDAISSLVYRKLYS